jgi:peptidoglycan hydrolase CwlO-like protein
MFDTEAIKMMKKIRNPLLLIVLLFSALSQQVVADERQMYTQQDSEGFYVSLRDVSDITITHHLQQMQVELETKINQLQVQVQKKSFKVIDTLITIVMPGGLVYAKLRHDSYKRSERALAEVNKELKLISNDLIAFKSANGEFMVARVE